MPDGTTNGFFCSADGWLTNRVDAESRTTKYGYNDGPWRVRVPGKGQQ
ncbi:MAG: hypothetical protein R6V03_03635 [Kiritimatiellia bacterium]